jgi:hypothetical protein
VDPDYCKPDFVNAAHVVSISDYAEGVAAIVVGDGQRAGQRDMRKAQRYRCFLNGEDVTNRTFYSDSRRGVVRMFSRNEHGKLYAEDGEVATEERQSRVRLVRRAA